MNEDESASSSALSAHFTVLDPGLSVSLAPPDARSFTSLIETMCQGDVQSLGDNLILLNTNVISAVDEATFRASLNRVVGRHVAPGGGVGVDGKPVCVGVLAGEILTNLRDHGKR